MKKSVIITPLILSLSLSLNCMDSLARQLKNLKDNLAQLQIQLSPVSKKPTVYRPIKIGVAPGAQARWQYFSGLEKVLVSEIQKKIKSPITINYIEAHEAHQKLKSYDIALIFMIGAGSGESPTGLFSSVSFNIQDYDVPNKFVIVIRVTLDEHPYEHELILNQDEREDFKKKLLADIFEILWNFRTKNPNFLSTKQNQQQISNLSKAIDAIAASKQELVELPILPEIKLSDPKLNYLKNWSWEQQFGEFVRIMKGWSAKLTTPLWKIQNGQRIRMEPYRYIGVEEIPPFKILRELFLYLLYTASSDAQKSLVVQNALEYELALGLQPIITYLADDISSTLYTVRNPTSSIKYAQLATFPQNAENRNEDTQLFTQYDPYLQTIIQNAPDIKKFEALYWILHPEYLKKLEASTITQFAYWLELSKKLNLPNPSLAKIIFDNYLDDLTWLLIRDGIDPNIQDEHGHTVLHYIKQSSLSGQVKTDLLVILEDNFGMVDK